MILAYFCVSFLQAVTGLYRSTRGLSRYGTLTRGSSCLLRAGFQFTLDGPSVQVMLDRRPSALMDSCWLRASTVAPSRFGMQVAGRNLENSPGKLILSED